MSGGKMLGGLQNHPTSTPFALFVIAKAKYLKNQTET
jgi:hypothetical protein